jgi:3-deoxy-D-manno-octulosonic-acid transferase
MHSLYNFSIVLFSLFMRFASLFNHKAKLWVSGRKNWEKDLKSWREANSGSCLWIHCASLGEFEQGRTVMEAYRKANPDHQILLTFFSPSGFEIRKNYAVASQVMYLPVDTRANARSFLELLQPTQIIFVKYEYWANYFFESRKRNIPLYMVSAIMRSDQRFFGVFRSFWKDVLLSVNHFFVQNEETIQLLGSLGFENSSLAGDTRYDRVAELPKQRTDIEEIAVFKGNSFLIVAGSSWQHEEEMLSTYMHDAHEKVKLLLVPHEVDEKHLQSIQKQFPSSKRWSEWKKAPNQSTDVLVMDTIGMLSMAYQYADVAVIGGGFGKGIHNTLEAAVWGIPVLFGPNNEKFAEATMLMELGGGRCFLDEEDLRSALNKLLYEPRLKEEMGRKAALQVKQQSGATQKIMAVISR